MKEIYIIAAVSHPTLGIGINGRIPWKITTDMSFFTDITTDTSENKTNAVIMGRKTWESIPKKFRPLRNRTNVVISRDENAKEKYNIPDSVVLTHSFDTAINILSNNSNIDQIFVIGGETIYREAIESSLCSRLYITQVISDTSLADTYFPVIPNHFKMTKSSDFIIEKNIKYRFTQYDKEL